MVVKILDLRGENARQGTNKGSEGSMPIVIAYARVPQRASLKGVASLDAQCRAMIEWAKRRRYRLLSVVTEEISSAPLDQRKGLAEAMLGLRETDATGLVVHQLTCLDEDLVVQEQLLAEFQSLGARLFSVDPLDRHQLLRTPPDPSRRAVRHILSLAAANEHALMALRANSTRTATGSPPYGYRSENGAFVADPAEQETLNRIAELRGCGATLREIARTLHEEGRQPKRSERWHPESLRRIVERLET